MSLAELSPAVLADPRLAPLVAAAATRPTGSAALAVALAVRSDLWEPRIGFREESRWTALLEPDDVRPFLDPSLHAELDDAQIWLLTWLPGQGTPLHDPDSSTGAFAVARGSLSVRVVASGGPNHTHKTKQNQRAGRLRYFGPLYVLQV